MKNKIKIEYMETNKIIPYKNNTKKHNNKQVKQISESIKEFDFNNPIIIDNENIVIAGHGRLLASKELKIKEVPVVKISHLTEAQKKAYRIADNKITENSEWDFDLLKTEFKSIEALDFNFDICLTGFESINIDSFFDEKILDKKTDINELQIQSLYIDAKEIVSNFGDIWQLGKHRIICGNALKEESYLQLLENKKADMVFTDPPYNVKIGGNVCGRGKFKHKEFKMASGEMSSDDFQSFLTSNFTLLKRFSKNGSLSYVCMDWRHIKEISNAGLEVFDELNNLCVWNKNNGGMGSLYRSKHELVFVFKNGKLPHKNNIELGSHGRNRTNIWDYPSINSWDGERTFNMHPTAKPVELIKDAILDVTNRNDIVLDTFLGSGSTLMASEQVGRICYGIELEPLYIDTTIKRYEETFNKEAFNITKQKTYKELLKIKKEL